LIGNADKALELIRAARSGVPSGTAISLKTRLGFRSVAEAPEWLGSLLNSDIDRPDCLTVHLRTKEEMSKCDAHWELAQLVADLCAEAGVVSVGNGDVRSVEHGEFLAQDSGLDGYMIGRAAIGNPWALFRAPQDVSSHRSWKKRTHRGSADDWPVRAGISLDEVLDVLVDHAHAAEQAAGDNPGKFLSVRKHLGKYCTGFDGAKFLRTALVTSSSAVEVEQLVAEFRDKVRDGNVVQISSGPAPLEF
jgi:tRNA-dihydrouridine synthase